MGTQGLRRRSGCPIGQQCRLLGDVPYRLLDRRQHRRSQFVRTESTMWPEGVAVSDVPDMVDPADNSVICSTRVSAARSQSSICPNDRSGAFPADPTQLVMTVPTSPVATLSLQLAL